jgi:hypothetical protein
MASVRAAVFRVAAVRVAIVRVAAVRVAVVRVAAVRVAAVRVPVRQVGIHGRRPNYSLHQYWSSIQLKTFDMTTMRSRKHDSKPNGANQQSQGENKTVNWKERSQIQEPTQKEKRCRSRNGKYRIITNCLTFSITLLYRPNTADWHVGGEMCPLQALYT